jgi:hypothetical protein
MAAAYEQLMRPQVPGPAPIFIFAFLFVKCVTPNEDIGESGLPILAFNWETERR